MLRRSWCEINLEQLKDNYLIFKKRLPKDCQITAVVKADAYGHGAVFVARALQTVGCASFAVASLDEAVALRKGGVKGEILILGYTPTSFMKIVKRKRLCQVVYSTDYAEEVIKAKVPIKVQIAIDTGMNRIGFKWNSQEEILQTCEKIKGLCKIDGIFTHLACADCKDKEWFTNCQINRFFSAVSMVKHMGIKNKHFCNSACFLVGGHEFLNSVRLGICLYGLGDNLPIGVKPILTWKSVVVMVKKIKAGEGVGYGHSFVAKSDMMVATVATGYADGFKCSLSSDGKVEIRGSLARVIGRICMDMFMVDVTGIDGVKMGDEVVLIGDKCSAEDLAKKGKTIPYEIVCSISKRVSRVYLKSRHKIRKKQLNLLDNKK